MSKTNEQQLPPTDGAATAYTPAELKARVVLWDEDTAMLHEDDYRRLLATLDALRAKLADAERERDAARAYIDELENRTSLGQRKGEPLSDYLRRLPKHREAIRAAYIAARAATGGERDGMAGEVRR